MDFLHSKQIDLAIAIKTNQIQRDYLKNITEEHVRQTLFGYVWKHNKPRSISSAIDDILKINVNEIVAYLSNQAVVQGYEMNIEEVQNLMNQHS